MSGTLLDAFSQSKASAVREDTWGHLKAKPRHHHEGAMIFALDEYGGRVTSLHSEFSGVGSSPWFYQAHQDFMSEHAAEPGMVYVFRGYYVRTDAPDDCGRFVGDVKTCNIQLLLSYV